MVDRYVEDTHYDVYATSFRVGEKEYELNYSADLTLYGEGEYTGTTIEMARRVGTPAVLSLLNWIYRRSALTHRG